MKCLKVDEYIKRTTSVEETELLLQELEVSINTNLPEGPTTQQPSDELSSVGFVIIMQLGVCLVKQLTGACIYLRNEEKNLSFFPPDLCEESARPAGSDFV